MTGNCTIELHNADCMEIMARYPDGYFDLAIVDPPYGLQKTGNLSRMNGAGKLANRAINSMNVDFDKTMPDEKYFSRMMAKSDNQIIWGGNYFQLPPTRGIIWWDKCQPWPNFSAGELAWTSFDKPAKQFQFDNRTNDKIHPTQKPVELYKWLYANYAKPGMKILDTHLGSGSNAIAAYDMDMALFVGCELDTDYYTAAKARIEQHCNQQRLF